MKGLVKIWACKDCEKEYMDRPLVCTGCDGLDFYVKYGGILSEAEDELLDLIDNYKDDDNDKKKRVRM